MSAAAPDRVSICVATYRRPAGLERLLRGLDSLAFVGSPPEVAVVVVDNDPEGSARTVCDRLSGVLRWPLVYEHEPRRGLSFVRNRAVEAGRRHAERIAFIDDDEVPTPGWLEALLRVQREYDADVVLGPTLREFEGEVAPWIHRGGFFVEPRHPTGTRLEHGGIGNSLIHARVFDRIRPAFDDRMALAGGEDTHFFLRLVREGGSIVWADEAVVHEWIPPSRARAPWILQRVYRTANTWGLCEREIRWSPRTAALRVGKGLARIGMGLALLPVAPFLGRHHLVRALSYVCVGAGHIAGVAGLRYQEYRTIHGR